MIRVASGIADAAFREVLRKVYVVAIRLDLMYIG